MIQPDQNDFIDYILEHGIGQYGDIYHRFSLPNDGRRYENVRRRSQEFFYSFLSDNEVSDWTRNRELRLRSQFGQPYVLQCRQAFNVLNRTSIFCLDATDELPIYDVYALQKFLIENDEQAFLTHANAKPFCFYHPHLV